MPMIDSIVTVSHVLPLYVLTECECEAYIYILDPGISYMTPISYFNVPKYSRTLRSN